MTFVPANPGFKARTRARTRLQTLMAVVGRAGVKD
jgi:hypothetical protein